AAACKAVIHQFESDCRLHNEIKGLEAILSLFLLGQNIHTQQQNKHPYPKNNQRYALQSP
ncbi:MAG: hypothetical protein KKA41_11750, partial [Proteobacteria bacterium]|nr:hypothetical protein [Pseudomonadota bacterium]